jgi:hypothetical protein
MITSITGLHKSVNSKGSCSVLTISHNRLAFRILGPRSTSMWPEVVTLGGKDRDDFCKHISIVQSSTKC